MSLVGLIRETQMEQLITLKSGVVLRAVKMNSTVIPDTLNQFTRPKPPKVWIAEKGRDEENPNDPRYIDAENAYRIATSMAVNDAVILFGTAFVSKPDGVEGPEDPDWQEKARLIGSLKGDGKSARYLAWVKLVAAQDETDYTAIWNAVARLNGVAEKDVAQQTARFPDNS